MAIINNNWFNLNSTRRYPVDDFATGESDEGFDLPNDIITDIRLRFPRNLGDFAAISSINCSARIVTVTFVAHGGPGGFIPLAVVSLPKPVSPNVPYPVKAMSDGVFGWVVFGEGIEKKFAGRFSGIEQALIMPKLAFSYGNYPVTSMSIANDSSKLIRDVTLRGIGDLKVRKEVRTLYGITPVNAIVFSLDNESTNANLYEKYLGKCQGRPESESCNKVSVEFINDVQPDCFGNINIAFSGNGLAQETLVNSDLKGLALEMPLGLAEACTRDDYLPDNEGNLPNEYMDACAEYAASEGDPDAIATTYNLIEANPNLSSEVVSSTSTPHLDTLISAPGSSSPPYHFEFPYSSYESENTPYVREFPSGYDSIGLAVKSTGSRFIGVWNDDAANDHIYTSDVASSSTGCRVSVTFAFKQLASLGSAGVILDYSTVYVESCDKYVKTYILACLDSSSKRLRLIQWTGFKWKFIAQSTPITGLHSGTWYSIDCQKDTADTSGSKVKYRTKLFTATDYWAEAVEVSASSASSSSIEFIVGSTPRSGYVIPMGDNLIASLDAYAEPNDGKAGFGTITGSPVFSYFFVG